MAHRRAGSSASTTWNPNDHAEASSRAPLMTSTEHETSAYPERESFQPDLGSRHPYQNESGPRNATKESYTDQQTPAEHYSTNPFASSKLPLYNEADDSRDHRSTKKRQRWVWYTLAAVIGIILVLSLGRETSDIPLPAPWRTPEQSSTAVMPGVRNTITYSNGTQYQPVPRLKVVGIVFCMFRGPFSGVRTLTVRRRWTPSFREHT